MAGYNLIQGQYENRSKYSNVTYLEQILNATAARYAIEKLNYYEWAKIYKKVISWHLLSF